MRIQLGVTHYDEHEDDLLVVADRLDVVEIKYLEPAYVEAKRAVWERFAERSLHVQYLTRHGQPLTLNLANPEVCRQLGQISNDVYRVFKILRPTLCSFHGGFACEILGVRGPDRHNEAQSPVLAREEVLSRLVRSLKTAQDRLRSLGLTEPEILVENLDYRPTGAYEYVTEGAFLAELLAATGAGLLLDLAHLMITAHSRQIDALALLEEMTPALEHLREVHVCSPAVVSETELWDINRPFDESALCIELLREVLARNAERSPAGRRLLLNCECPTGLARQLDQLQVLVSEVEHRPTTTSSPG
jgi:hypothetical protein